VPDDIAELVVLRETMVDAQDIVSPSTLPTYQPSAQSPLASGKVRFVGEPVAMAFAPTRAQAEDLVERVEVDYEELPVYADAWSALAAAGDLVHETWRDNRFVTLKADKDFEQLARRPRSRSRAASSCRASAWCRWKARPCWPTGTSRPTSWWWSARPRCRT